MSGEARKELLSHEWREGDLVEGSLRPPGRRSFLNWAWVGAGAFVFVILLPALFRSFSKRIPRYVFPTSLEPFLSALGANQLQLDYEFYLKRSDVTIAWSRMGRNDKETFFKSRGLTDVQVKSFFDILKTLQEEQNCLEADAEELLRESAEHLPSCEEQGRRKQLFAQRVARLVIRKEVAVAALSAMRCHLRRSEDAEDERAVREVSEANQALTREGGEKGSVDVFKRTLRAAAALVFRDNKAVLEALNAWYPFPRVHFGWLGRDTTARLLDGSVALLLNTSSTPTAEAPELDRSYVASVVYFTFQNVKSPREEAIAQLLELIDAEEQGLAPSNADLVTAAEKAIQTTKAATLLARDIGEKFHCKDCGDDNIKRDVMALLAFLYHLF